MAKSDRTFSSKDVVRIVRNHLTPIERQEVILVLCQEERNVFNQVNIPTAEEEALEDTLTIRELTDFISSILSGSAFFDLGTDIGLSLLERAERLKLNVFVSNLIKR